MSREIKYLSLFSGIGGFEYGIQNNKYAHISKKPKQEERTQGGKWTTNKQGIQLLTRDRTATLCVGYSEIDKYADAIYQYQQVYGALRPFQQVSRRTNDSGNSEGGRRYAKPNNNGGKNYGDATKIITGELPDFDLLVGGFPCQAFSIAGKRKGFDDTRGTLFFEIARILRDKKPKHFILENVKGLLSHDKGRTFKTIIGVLSDIGYRVEWQVLNSKYFGVPQNRERVFIVGHLRGECGYQVFPIRKSKGVDDTPQGVTAINTAQGGNRQPFIPEDAKIRRLTPVECERLQGFPDNWTKYGIINGKKVEISDTQRYKCLGNAVTTNVVREVVSKLFKEE